MDMPRDIREMISNLGMRTGCVVVWNGSHVVRVIKARYAYYDLPHMFRGIPEYTTIRWHGCEWLMLDHMAEELRVRYKLHPKAVLKPKVYHRRSEDED
jgi:hypothetical protein